MEAKQQKTDQPLYEPHLFTRSPTVNIYVGADKVVFTVHKDLLCAKSEYFKASLADRWTELSGEGLVLHWETEKVKVMEMFMCWLYGHPDSIPRMGLTYTFECYKFADQRLLFDFKNFLVERIKTRLMTKSTHFQIQQVRELVDMDLANTPLYLFATKSLVQGSRRSFDILASTSDAEQKTWYKHASGTDIGVDMAREMLQPVTASVYTSWQGCIFHDHPEGQSCPRKIESPVIARNVTAIRPVPSSRKRPYGAR